MLLFLLIVVPMLELAVLLLSGKTIGVISTLLIIIITGILGAYLAKQQGMETIRKAQEQLHYGEIPGESIVDGICILIGGILLLVPGFITDIVGFLLLIPKSRHAFKRQLKKMFQKWIDRGNIWIIR